MNNQTLFFDKDIDISPIKNKKIGIIGYGNQGRAQALNLRDSKEDLIVGLRDGSKSKNKVKNDGIKTVSIEEAVKVSDVICLLVPDEEIKDLFLDSIQPYLQKGQTILFSHGYPIHFKHITPPNYIDVILVAPSGSGKMVRQQYLENKGVPNLLAVHQDFSGNAFDVALSYSKAIGGTRSGSFLSTFEEEVVTDIFGEQVILTGSIPNIIKESFNVLLEEGYSPEVVWLVCYYEVKNIVDSFHDKGFEFLNDSISNLAEYGGFTRGERLINSDVKSEMKTILKEIKDGSFEREWSKEKESNFKLLNDYRGKDKQSEIEAITKRLLELLKDNN